MALPFIYNVRNVVARKLSTGLTVTVVGVVVFVLAVLLSFAEGIRASLAASGSSSNVVVLAPGATSESTSIIRPVEAARITQTPGIAASSQGELLISLEIAVQASLPRIAAEVTLANVAVRGVDPIGLQVHQEFRLASGRRFEPGAMELIVGAAAMKRYQGLHIGDTVTLGRLKNREFRIVGTFSASGSAIESEIWGPRTIIGDAFGRDVISSALITVQRDQIPAAVQYLNGAAVHLQAKTETDYYADLATQTRQIVKLTTALIVIMAIGAAFAVANTMYATVDSRRREVAMLRTLGFHRPSILASFVIEALVICLPACALGLLGSSLLAGTKQDFLSEVTFTVLAYELTITPTIVAASVITAVLVGVAGALAPAIRAARTDVLVALRQN